MSSMWANAGLSGHVGPASAVLLGEYERRCAQSGKDSYLVCSFVASELGFEHNLGLLCSAFRTRATRAMRHGVIEYEYYLERCVLEAKVGGFLERGLVMCANVVGDDCVGKMCDRVCGYGAVKVRPVAPIPEVVVHPASTVGIAAEPELVPSLSGDFESGYCYLVLLGPEWRQQAAAELGECPTMRDILHFSDGGKRFVTDEQLASIVVTVNARGCHVEVGTEGVTFRELLDEVEAQPTAESWSVGGSDYLQQFGVGAAASDILGEWIKRSVGVESGLSESVLNLVSKSAALLGPDDKMKLRSLEAVGDSALSLMIAQDNYHRSGSAERFQNMRSLVTSNRVLSEKFVSVVPNGAVDFVGGVNPATGVTGAKALEAIFGAVWLELGADALSRLLVVMGIVEIPMQLAPGTPVDWGRGMMDARVGATPFEGVSTSRMRVSDGEIASESPGRQSIVVATRAGAEMLRNRGLDRLGDVWCLHEIQGRVFPHVVCLEAEDLGYFDTVDVVNLLFSRAGETLRVDSDEDNVLIQEFRLKFPKSKV